MNLRPFLVAPVAMTVMVATTYPVIADTKTDAVETVQEATTVFQQIMANPKTRIPQSVLRDALGIAVFPNVIQAGLIASGSRGNGILVVRKAQGSWSNPAFISITGGSVGFQAGARSSDIVMVFRNQKSINKVLLEDFTLGGEVSAAAGPVGGNVVSPTERRADIYTYARSQGLFGGVALKGQKIAVARKRNAVFYNQPQITIKQIFSTNLPTPSAVTDLKQALNQAVSGQL